MVNQQNHEETDREEVVEDTQAAPEATEGSQSAPAAEGDGRSQAEAEAAPSASEPETPRLVLPLSEMTPEERFRATTRLIFLAPDVPPVPIRPRREDLRELDDLLDQRFTGDRPSGGRSGDRNGFEDDRDQGSGRRRGRRRGGDGAPEDDAQRRPARQAPVITEPQKVKGSTRLEAKRQRRRDGRDAGRRRTVITESEFLARREAVDRQMVVRSVDGRIQIGVLEDKVLVEHYVARSSESSLIGNIYLGRVQNVLPSMEAAFVDIGKGRNAVLYSGEVDWSEFEGSASARRIENALKPGDSVLVQVTKDPVGHKGARLTSQISLPGRFLVYVPGGAMNGISRKLPDTERARLKKILKEVLPSGAGVIVRTAAEGASEEQLTRDVERLTRQWESIQKRTQKGGGPSLLHSEPDMLIKIVRDVFNEDFHRLVISGAETHGVIEDYLRQVAPDLLERVELYTGERDVFDEYRVSEQIAKALDRKVWLPSGGSLVIDRTEAMTVVDVNTGKFVGSGGNLEETVTKNNLEAAEEIVRQLRLRDIGGIIVVDFIDMVLESNRDLVLRRLVECLSRDRTKHQVAEVTSLGLVQMTRKKLGLGLIESFSEPCDTCAGRGIIVHHEPVHKHRGGDNGGSSRKRKGGGSQQQGQSAQTHAISNGAKNMLAQVAASTIGGHKADAEEAEHGSRAQAAASGEPAGAAREAQHAQGDASEPGGSQRGQAKRGSRRVSKPQASDTPQGEVPMLDVPEAEAPARETAEEQRPAVSRSAEPSTLLDSVLDALPDAPSAGKGRARRRATAPQTRVDDGANSAPEAAEGPRGSGPVDAAQALADALDATARERDAGRG